MPLLHRILKTSGRSKNVGWSEQCVSVRRAMPAMPEGEGARRMKRHLKAGLRAAALYRHGSANCLRFNLHCGHEAPLGEIKDSLIWTNRLKNFSAFVGIIANDNHIRVLKQLFRRV